MEKADASASQNSRNQRNNAWASSSPEDVQTAQATGDVAFALKVSYALAVTSGKWWQRPFRNHPFADKTLCHFLRERLILPFVRLDVLFPDFDTQAVSISELPKGGWSTPLADLVILLKLALCTTPQRILEVGSFRGYTALLLAQHAAESAHFVTVDSYPEHGEAYRQTPFSSRIQRRVGESNPAMFASDEPGSYDLIFIDADHSYRAVKRDTELVLPLVAPEGLLVWHDYANWGFFSGDNGVAEYLQELAAGGLQVARIPGTNLAIYSPAWSVEGPARSRYLAALTKACPKGREDDVWNSSALRG